MSNDYFSSGVGGGGGGGGGKSLYGVRVCVHIALLDN